MGSLYRTAAITKNEGSCTNRATNAIKKLVENGSVRRGDTKILATIMRMKEIANNITFFRTDPADCFIKVRKNNIPKISHEINPSIRAISLIGHTAKLKIIMPTNVEIAKI